MSAAADCCVVTGDNRTIAAYRLSDGKRLWSLEDFEPRTNPVLSRDCRLLAAIGQRGATVWSLDAGSPRLLWEAAARFFTFSPDGQHAAFSTADGRMHWVRAADGETVRTIGSGSARSPFAFDAASGRIAVCVANSVQVIASGTGEIEFELPLGNLREPLVACAPAASTWPCGGTIKESCSGTSTRAPNRSILRISGFPRS